jgi:di/tricarboxylate transporter
MTKAIDWNMVLLFGNGSIILSLGMETRGLVSWIGTLVSYNIGSEFTSLAYLQ